MTFHQDPPRLADTWLGDPALRAMLRRLLPNDVHTDVAPDLARMGRRAATDLLALDAAAEAEPPRHVPYDAWGRRVDRIAVSDAWRALDRISAEEGLVAIAYARAHGAWSRVHQLAKLYLFHPSSATYSCPLAMTDGAARCLELHAGDDAALRRAFAHLTSRDPSDFWTSGQWMTERIGGSDVSRTETVATPVDDPSHGSGQVAPWRLHGVKWFTSATTSQMALALARIEGAPDVGTGLGLFQIELRDADGALRGIRVERLKEKLGTRALPTAELTLDGAPGRLVGGAGRGVATVAAVLNVTRVYNAVCAAASLRRGVMLARDYATRRIAFGRSLLAHPLHAETLAALEVEARGALALVLHLARLVGREECGEASDAERAVLRLLTPIAKLYTARQAVAGASEAIEAFGGAGYIEDTGLPRLLRDTQVLSIWEGTTNVLSLDVLRALGTGVPLAALRDDLAFRLERASSAFIAEVERVREAVDALVMYAHRAAGATREDAEAGARSFAMRMGDVVIAVLLLEHAAWAHRVHDADAHTAAIAARRWCARDLGAPSLVDASRRDDTDELLRILS